MNLGMSENGVRYMDINGMIGEIDDKPVDLGISNFPTNSYGDVDLMYFTYRLPTPVVAAKQGSGLYM